MNEQSLYHFRYEIDPLREAESVLKHAHLALQKNLERKMIPQEKKNLREAIAYFGGADLLSTLLSEKCNFVINASEIRWLAEI